MEVIYPSVKSNQGMELRNEHRQSDATTNRSNQCASNMKGIRDPNAHYSS